MEGPREFYPQSIILTLPYIVVNHDYVSLEGIDPAQHPTLKPFFFDENTLQYVCLGSITYQVLYANDGYVFGMPPNYVQIPSTVPPEVTNFYLPWPTPKKRQNTALTRDDVQAYLLNPILQHMTADLYAVLTLMGHNSLCEEWLNYRLWQLAAYGTQAFVNLLEYNGEISSVVECSTVDYFYFLKTYPDREVPSRWFEIDAIDCVNPCVPLQNGKVHLSYMEMEQWIRFKCAQARIFARTRVTIEGLPEQLQGFRVKKAEKRQRSNNLVDIEDMGKLGEQLQKCAPCCDTLFSPNRSAFPVDSERIQIVPLMRTAKYSEETVLRLFQMWFDKFPNGYTSLERRWNPVSYYRVGYAPPSCDEMGYCPFETDKVACHAEFRRRYPEKYRVGDEEKFWGPASWLYWQNRY